MINCFKRILGIRKSPTAEETDNMLKDCERIVNRLESVKQEDESLSEMLNSAKDNLKKLKSAMKFKDDSLDKEDWDKKQEKEKIDIYMKLNNTFRDLKTLNRKEIKCGIAIFFLASVLFAFIIYVYLAEHGKYSAKSGPEQKVSSLVIVDIESIFIIMEDRMELFNQGKEKLKKEEKISFREQFEKLKSIITKDPLEQRLSFKVKKALGTLEGEIAMRKVKKETLNECRKLLEAEIESLSTKYFWTDAPRKWLEIVFWSLFGIMVGILYHIAGSLGSGIFNTSEITMMATEIIITPPVVVIVFFLFPLTGITNFNPTETSILTTLGISFILGFSIRRTVGLLDNIKKRLLPDPPSEGSK